ncbi:MAG: hypothetical protein QG633_202 [Patescibacteria group bacterium]|jgi:hypothetical protein|nr:hypothetical protein [Patescibacteria group bacterium]
MKIVVVVLFLIALGFALWILRNILKNWGEKINHLEMWHSVGRNVKKWANENENPTGRLQTTIVGNTPFGGYISVTWRFGEESDPVLQMRYFQEQPLNRICIEFSLHGNPEGFYNMTPGEFKSFLRYLEREIQKYKSPQQKNGKSRLP